VVLELLVRQLSGLSLIVLPIPPVLAALAPPVIIVLLINVEMGVVGTTNAANGVMGTMVAIIGQMLLV